MFGLFIRRMKDLFLMQVLFSSFHDVVDIKRTMVMLNMAVKTMSECFAFNSAKSRILVN